MQAVLAIPGLETMRNSSDPADVLMQPVAGVPLLVRVIATAARANVDSVLIVWPEGVNPRTFESRPEWALLKGLRIDHMLWAGAFDPRNAADWSAIAARLEDEFVWLPWNWVTHKRALAGLTPSSFRPVTWQFPVLLEMHAVLNEARFRVSSVSQAHGVQVTSPQSVPAAERFLVQHSGKPTDGIYSNFNRRLCRPAVRFLSRTRATPNGLTLAGLLVAIFAAFMFARGSYLNYVAGALLFFVSGLFDEMDGMIARLKFRESAFGTWFEGFVDNITYLAIFVGIMIGLNRQYGNWALKYGIALIVGCVLSVIVIALQRKLATSKSRPHEYSGKMNQLMEADSSNLFSRIARQIHIFVKKGVLVHYLFLFAVVGAMPLFLWIAAIGSNLTWIGALYFTRRFFRRPPLQAAQDVARAA